MQLKPPTAAFLKCGNRFLLKAKKKKKIWVFFSPKNSKFKPKNFKIKHKPKKFKIKHNILTIQTPRALKYKNTNP